MILSEIMAELEKVGTEKLRASYALHGATGNYFGVSPAQFNRLKKKIGCDQALAVALWNTKNIDAQILGIMIVDTDAVSEQMIDQWVKEINYYTVADIFIEHVVLLSKWKLDKMISWIRSNEEYVRRCGYRIMMHVAQQSDSLTNEAFIEHLHVIGKEIQLMENRARQAMYDALIAIGKRNKVLNMEAMIVASQVGPVYIEHGDKKLKATHAMEILADKKLRATLV